MATSGDRNVAADKVSDRVLNRSSEYAGGAADLLSARSQLRVVRGAGRHRPAAPAEGRSAGVRSVPKDKHEAEEQVPALAPRRRPRRLG